MEGSRERARYAGLLAGVWVCSLLMGRDPATWQQQQKKKMVCHLPSLLLHRCWLGVCLAILPRTQAMCWPRCSSMCSSPDHTTCLSCMRGKRLLGCIAVVMLLHLSTHQHLLPPPPSPPAPFPQPPPHCPSAFTGAGWVSAWLSSPEPKQCAGLGAAACAACSSSPDPLTCLSCMRDKRLLGCIPFSTLLHLSPHKHSLPPCLYHPLLCRCWLGVCLAQVPCTGAMCWAQCSSMCSLQQQPRPVNMPPLHAGKRPL